MAILNPDFYKEVVLGDNPIHYWRFNDPIGSSVASNEIFSGLDLIVKDPSLVSWQIDSLILSDTINKSISIDDFTLILHVKTLIPRDIKFSYSVELWLNIPASSFNNAIWAHDTLGRAATNSSGHVTFTSNNNFTATSSNPLVAGTTHHLVFTRVREASCQETLRIYIDGKLSGVPVTQFECGRGSAFGFGGLNAQPGDIFDEFAIYHTALDANQVSNHYFASQQNVAVGIPGVGLEYEPILSGNKWYYTHNTHGTKWFDTVDNQKGWTADFNMKVNQIVNTDWVLDEERQKGVGIYVNDGTRRESINFLTQEIDFYHSDKKVTYDTTSETDYRLIGKGDSLKLFAKKPDEKEFFELTNTIFPQKASDSGNGYKPATFEDIRGIVHTAWFDDGNKTGQIYYSSFSNGLWSTPELVIQDSVGAQNPDVLVDNDGTVYIIYESKTAENSNIGLISKNDIGWGKSKFVGISDDRNKMPKATFDSQFNILVVWEDHRHVHPEIYIVRFSKTLQQFEAITKLTTTKFGAYNPSISSYLDDIFISWTKKDPSENTSIELLKYFSLTGTFTDSVSVTTPDELVDFTADYSDVLVNVAGKVLVTWHSRVTGRFEIYLARFTIDLTRVQDNIQITNSRGGSQYPVLSEHQISADVYIVWHDFQTGTFTEFDPLALSRQDTEYGSIIIEDEYIARKEEERPLDCTVYIALFRNLDNVVLSSNQNNSFDIVFNFPLDNRSACFPSVPSLFIGELPVVYESPFADTSGFLPVGQFFNQIRSAFYNLSRNKEEFDVTNGIAKIVNPSFDTIDRDYEITGQELKKEIRFGNFSNTVNSSLTFKNFKYYTNGAVEPFSIKEVDADSFPVTNLTAHDAAINNYGDVWIVGTCGMLYYINTQNRLVLLQSTDGAELKGPAGNIKAITFDKHGYMFIGSSSTVSPGVYVSTEHVNGFILLEAIPNVTSLAFDKDNNLYVGTGEILVSGGSSGSLKIYSVKDNNAADSSVPVIFTKLKDSTEIGSSLPNEFVTAIQVDENNIVWVSTYNGLYRLFRDQVLKFDTKTGFPSNRINDITIRNTAIRYLATSSGIVKMIGSGVDDWVRSDDDKIWNNNTKCILWQDPNVLWAGTLSKVNQILVNDVDRTYSTSIYEPGASFSVDKNDLRTYYIINDDPAQSIADTDIVEARINGELVSKNAFNDGFDNKINQRIIRFKTPLNNDDVVEVTIRKDLLLKTDFKQSPAEKNIAGNKLIRIKELAVANNLLYLVTEGSENGVKVNDSDNKLPFDKVHLDTTSPSGAITITEQLDRSVVKVGIDITSEGYGDGKNGSGVDRMVVSNFSNFTTDGETPQVPVLFASSLTHDLGLSLEDLTNSFNFDFSTGSGETIQYFPEINQLYVGSSNPAKLLKFSFVDQVWSELISYEDGEFVDFITRYNNLLVVSVGHSSNVARLFIYNIVFSGDVFDRIELLDILGVLESRAFSFQELKNLLYIGTGLGEGDPSSGISSGTNGGKIYVYDGLILTEVVAGLDENVYGITHTEGSNNLIAVTGPSGFVYEVDIDNEGAFIIYNDTDKLISAEAIVLGSQKLIFVGNANTGIVRRSKDNSSSFDISIKTVAGDVSVLKIFVINDTDVLYAAIGKVVYFLSDAGSWVWRHTHSEDIKDLAFNSGTEDVYILSENKIDVLKPLLSEKCIYLKLIDRAGNESVIDNTIASEDNSFIDCITIESLRDFVNENKLFELDQFGNTVFSLRGNTPFYAGQKVDEEKGVFISEIFDGSNDLVKWETISWQATELAGTEVLMYVRVSNSKNDILLEDWKGPYVNDKSGGVDISFLSGQFIQFKVELTSTRKDISPSFHSANIISVTTEAVHFFTTNFVLPSNITKGILTSEKLVPVSADVVFALNTTNSVDFSDYQIIEENRLFNMNQTGSNLRVGIKFISPSRGDVLPTSFDEYGPYDTELFVNTIDFLVVNSSAFSNNYHFKLTLYEDFNLEDQVFSTFSKDNQDGFSSGGIKLSESGLTVNAGGEALVILNVPGTSNVVCNTFYFIKIESTDDDGVTFNTLISAKTFVTGCTSSFVDVIDFDFTNDMVFAHDFHFRMRFYEDPERTNLFLTEYSGNNRAGWFVNDVQIPEEGASVGSGDTSNVIFRPDLTKFEPNTVFYLTIDSFNGTEFNLASNSFTFQARDIVNAIYCGGYSDVPVVKNFALMFELENNELVTLNI